MNKEAQILANELYMLDNGRHSIDYDAWASRIILNGYRKLPKDKSPLPEIVCPFCGTADFDLIGLKYHLTNHCSPYREAKAQLAKAKPIYNKEKQEAVKQGREVEAQDIIHTLQDFLRVHPKETLEGAIELLKFREETRQALKGE